MKFQTILLIFFGLMTVVAVVLFSQASKSPKDPAIAGAHGTIVIWGTFPDGRGLATVMSDFNKKYKDSFQVIYQYHDPKKFDNDIVEALASGKGPDVLLLPDDLILRHSDKIEALPYVSVPQRTLQTTFIQAGEIYMRDQGTIALPFVVDPIVMYWNRDLFDNASVSEPPQYWDEFLNLAPKLTKQDPKTQDIQQSTIAFGEYVNVNNAKDILAMLFLQVGNPIVTFANGKPTAALQSVTGTNQVAPNQDVVSAFRFFMDFSNPLKSIYTWNRAQSNSRDEFLSGNLAVYFGFASEYKSIQAENPHLNFAVAPVPQPRGTKVEITFARMHGLAVMKSSQNKQTAFIAVQRLLDSKPSGDFAAAFNLPPVRRDLLAKPPTDAVMSVLYDAAIRARTWLDPRPDVSDGIFQQTVESVSSGRNTIPDAVSFLQDKLSSALKPY